MSVYEQLMSQAANVNPESRVINTRAGTVAASDYAASLKNGKAKTKAVNKVDKSYANYLAGKTKYGSSSAWYDAAVKEQKDKQSFVDTLQYQLSEKQKGTKDRYHLTGKQKAEGKTANRPWMSENWSVNDGKSLEDLQKELEQAKVYLTRADEELKYALEWKNYDADMSWLDSVKESGQDWGFVSDNLYKMYGAIDSRYNELMDSIQKAEKNNGYLDNLRRQGGIPAEVGFEYTGEEEIARMYDELYELGELRDMANRRYSYSVDELIKKGDDVRLGRVKAYAYNKDAEEANAQARAEYAENHVKGDTMGGVWDVLRTDQSSYSPGESWSEDQLNRYYVIFQRQGAEAAKKFAAEVNTYNNLEHRNQDMEKFRAFGAERSMEDAEGFWGKLGAGLADTGRGLAGTALEVAGMPGDLLRYLDKTQDVIATGTYTGDTNASVFKYGLSDYGGAISEGRAETLNQLGTVSGKGLGDLYRLTGSMAQSLVYGNLAGSAGTLTLFFGSAANQGFDEAMSRGASGEQAMVYGMLSGIGEAAAEFIPLENLLNADKSLTRGFLKAALYQAGFEGLEEGETDILNTIADQLVLKDKSEINSAIRMRMAQGESYEQAAKAEWSKLVKDVVWDMVGGAISGAGSSAIQYGVHLASPYQANAQGEYRYGADARTLAAEAAAIPEGDKELAKVRSLGQKTAARVEQGKTVSNRTVEKLAKGTNRAAMVDAVEQQLNERAENVKKEDRRMMANAIVSVARNEAPGPKGKRLIEANKEISDSIIKELDIKQPAKWAQQIGVRGVEGIAYGDKSEMQAYKKVKADASAINASKDEPMYTEVSIPTDKGEVSGKLTGLSMKKKPAFIIQAENGKLNEVPIDVAINSGALPDGVAKLAWEVQGLGDIAGEAYKLYEPGQDITDYVTDLKEAIALAGDVSTREVFNKSETVNRLTKQQQAFAWNEGLQRDNKATAESGGARVLGKRKDPVKRGRVSFSGAKVYGNEYKATSKDKIKANELRAIETIAKAANVDVVFYETDSNSAGDYIGANGFYHNGTIYLDIHAKAKNSSQQDAILLTAAHELTHHIRENAPKQYEALKAFVTDHLIEHGYDFEQMVQSRLAEPNMSRDEAVEEVVADACEMVLKDSKAVEKLAKENKSLAETIADWLHGFYEDLKAAFEGKEAMSREAKAMTEYMDELTKLWDDALVEASKGAGQSSGKVKQQARDSRGNVVVDETVTLQSVKKTLEDIYAGKHKKQSFTFPVLKHTPQVFMDYCRMDGDRSFVMDSKKAYKAMQSNAEHQHGLGVDGMMAVIQNLYTPLYILEQTTGPNAGHYVAIVQVDGEDVVAAVDLGDYRAASAGVAGESGYYNVLITAFYPIDGYIESNLFNSENIVVYDAEVDKKYEIPTQVASGEPPFGHAMETSDNSILNSDTKVKHSRRDSSEGLSKEEARAQSRSYTKLAAEEAALKRRIDYWQEQNRDSRHKAIVQKDVEKFAKQLVKQHGSTVSAKWIKQQIQALGNYMVQNDELNFDWMRTVTWKTATDIAEKAQEVYDDGYDKEKREAIAGAIKEERIYVDPKYKEKLPEGFRKDYSGKLHISFKEEEGLTDVDSIYEQLQEAYGYELFPHMPSAVEELIMLGEAYDRMTDDEQIKYNPYANSMNEAITSISNDILDFLLSDEVRTRTQNKKEKSRSVQQEVLKAQEEAQREAERRREAVKKEKAAKWEKFDKAKHENRDRVKELRDSKNARIEDIKRQESARRKEMRAKEKAAKWEKVAAVKKHYRDQIKREREERNESAAAQRYRASIYKSIDRLSKLLLSNSDKYHVPEALKEPVLDFITSIDVSSRRLLNKGEATLTDEKYTEKMQRLKTVLGRQRAYMQKPGEVDGLDVFLDLPDGFEEMMEAHIESMTRLIKEHKLIDEMGPVNYMNSRQLYELDHILTVLSSSISQINSFITESRYESVKDSARESRQYMRSLGTEVQRALARDMADRFFSWGNALPIYVFKRFGEAGSERFAALTKGWGQMAMNAQFILNFTNDVYSTEEVREWEETVHRFELSDGRKVQMTTAQIMGLYCSFKREQARQHLLTGGMRVGNIQTGKGAKKTVISQVDAFHLTHDDIIAITGELSARQMEVANRLQEFMNSTCADWGNEISMARFGYRQFTEENYYPITTDPNNFPAVDPQARENDIFRLLNMAFTKQLNPKANNSIVINSIFDVFSAHAADMAKYNALALPILDMMKWYNYKDTSHTDVEDSMGNVNRQLRAESVQSITERAYGKQAQKYMINFLKDLNGQREGGRNEDMLKGFLGRYKAAAVGANIRVAIQQPTSIVRASYVLHPGYLARGAAMKGGIEEALQHSGIAVWKSLGYFDTNIARGMRQQIKHADSGMDKLRDKGMWLAEQGDKITWGAIWNACKLEQEDKGLKGEELIKATVERFDEVILSTQVLDSTISRSDMMRNQSLAVSEITSFMSEPTVSYNMLLDSVTRLITIYRQTGDWSAARREAWPYMGKALLVFSAGTLATAAAAALVDALRDDDDYQNYAEKWLEAMKKNTLQGINPARLLPFISDLWEIAVKDEAPESMLYQSFTQARKGVTAAVDMAKLMFDPEADVSEPNRTSWGRLYYVAQAVGSISGVPVAGFMREFKTVWNMSGALITGKKLKNYDSGVKNNIKYAVMDKYLEPEEAVALLMESGEYTDPDDAYWAVQEWANAEDSEWSRYNDVYAAVLADDARAYEAAVDALGDHGIAAQSVRTTVKNQIGRWFIGGEDVTETIDEKTAVQALQDYAGLLPIEAQHYIDQLKFEKKYNMRYSEMKDAYLAGQFSAAEVRNFRQVYGHEKRDDAAATVREWDFEKESGITYSQINDAYINGDISREQYAKWQKQYGGMSPAEIEDKLLKLEAARDYGVALGSSTSGIKAYVLEGAMDPETGKHIMMHYDGKTEEQADAYMNQYLFTKETGYDWRNADGVMQAYADGIINDAEAKQWFKHGLINGSELTASEYLDVAKWRRDVSGAEEINREAIQKWNERGETMLNAGLGKEDFAEAWKLYNSVSSQYDKEGIVVKEKKAFFFDELYAMYKAGRYSLKEIDAIAKTVYAPSTVRKSAPW